MESGENPEQSCCRNDGVSAHGLFGKGRSLRRVSFLGRRAEYSDVRVGRHSAFCRKVTGYEF